MIILSLPEPYALREELGKVWQDTHIENAASCTQRSPSVCAPPWLNNRVPQP